MIAKNLDIEQLSQDLKAQFPEVEIEIRKSDDPNGFQFLNLVIGDFEVAVEWKDELGFGISSFHKDSSLDGLFDSPIWCLTEQAAFFRVASLVCDCATQHLQ